MIALAILGFNFIDGFNLSFPVILVGIIASTISAYLMMSFMLELAKKIKFYYFTLIIGIIALLPFLIKALIGL